MVVGVEGQNRARGLHADIAGMATARTAGLLALDMATRITVLHGMQQGAERDVRHVLPQSATGALRVEIEQAPFALPEGCLDRGVVDILQARVEHVFAQRAAPRELEPAHQARLGIPCQLSVLRRHRVQELQITEMRPVQHGVPGPIAGAVRSPRSAARNNSIQHPGCVSKRIVCLLLQSVFRAWSTVRRKGGSSFQRTPARTAAGACVAELPEQTSPLQPKMRLVISSCTGSVNKGMPRAAM